MLASPGCVAKHPLPPDPAAVPAIRQRRQPRFVAPCARITRWIGRFAVRIHLADRFGW